MGDRDRVYLIEILLRARDEFSKIFSDFAKSQEQATKAEKGATEQRGKDEAQVRSSADALSKLTEAHVREKGATDNLAGSIAKLKKAHQDYLDLVKKDKVSRADQIDQLKRFGQEWDNLAKKSDVGSRMAIDLAQVGRAAKEQAAQMVKTQKEAAASIQRELDSVAQARKSANKNALDDERKTQQQIASFNDLASKAHIEMLGKMEDADNRYEAEREKREQAALASQKRADSAAAASHAARLQQERKDDDHWQAEQDAADRHREQAEDAALAADIRRSSQQAANLAKESKALRDASKDLTDHLSRVDEVDRGYQDLVASMNDGSLGIDQTRARLKNTAKEYDSLARSQHNSRDESLRFGDAAESVRHRLADFNAEMRNTERGTKNVASGMLGFISSLRGGEKAADGSKRGVEKLSLAFQGFQVAFAIKYASALITMLVGLAGELVSVASAAIQAGGALAGSFVSGMLQAVPVVGLLGAALFGVSQVVKAVNLAQQNKLLDAHNAATSAKQQVAAADSIRSAEDSLASAHQAVADAQTNAINADLQRIRTLQDLVDAQKKAKDAADDADLSLEQAQARLRQAINTGDATGIASAQNDVRDAREGVPAARRAAGRATQDLRLARSGQTDPGGAIAASKALTDARKREKDATRSVAEARSNASATAEKETSAVDRLQAMIDKFTPAQKRLYTSMTETLGQVKKIFIGTNKKDGITGVIISSFSDALDRVRDILKNNKLLGDLQTLADAIAHAIKHATGVLSSPGSVDDLGFFTKQATKNLPIIEKIFTSVFSVIRTVGKAAAPALHDLLKMFEGFADSGDKLAKGNAKGITKFFQDGIKTLGSFIKLGLAAIDVLLALFGTSAPKQGRKGIDDLTDSLKDAAGWIRENTKRVNQFFTDARKVFDNIIQVVVEVAKQIARIFDPGSSKAFADFMTKVVIPAIAEVVILMGKVTKAAHEILSLPGVSEFAKVFLTVTLLAKGLALIASAVAELFAPLAALGESLLGAFGVSESGAAAFGGPVGIAIVAIITAILLLDKKFHFLAPTLKWLKGAMEDTWKFIKKVSQPVLHWLGQAAQDAFGWLKKAGQDFVAWVSDVWNQGALLPLKLAFEAWIGYVKHFVLPVWGWIIDAAITVVDFFIKGPWWAVGKAIAAPFSIGLKLAKQQFKLIALAVRLFIDLLSGRFGHMGDDIKDIFGGTFDAVYKIVAKAFNGIIDLVNKVIGALDKVLPKSLRLPSISLQLPDTLEGLQTLKSAKSGNAPSLDYGGPHAQGGYVSAKPGGKLIHVGEDHHDEVVLTTDPKHGQRQRGLLGEYLKRAPHIMGYATGGFVAQPGTDFTRGDEPKIASDLRKLAALLRVTVYGISGYRSPQHSVAVGGFANDPHTRGQAADIGINAPTLASTAGLSESILRKVGLYRPFYPADPNEMNHVQLVSGGGGVLSKIGHAVTSAVTAVPKIIAQSALKTLGKRPTFDKFGMFGAPMNAVYSSLVGFIRDSRDKVQGLVKDPIANVAAQGASANVVSQFRKAISQTHAPSIVQLALWEGGIVESGLRNLNFGDADSLGALQERASIYGKAHALNPLASATRFIRDAMALLPWKSTAGLLAAAVQRPRADLVGRYDAVEERARNYLGSTGHSEGGPSNFAVGGPIPGRGPVPIMAHGGEHMWTEDEVRRAGGHGVMHAMRSMLGGGGQGRGGSYQSGGRVAFNQSQASARSRVAALIAGAQSGATTSSPLNDFLKVISTILPGLERSKNMASKIRTAFEAAFEDGGPFDRLSKAVDAIATKAAQRLQEMQFSVSRGGVASRNLLSGAAIRTQTGLGLGDLQLQDAATAQASVGTLRQTRSGLNREAGGLQASLGTAQAAYKIAVARGNTKAAQQAQAQIKSITDSITAVDQALAQNRQDIVEAQESFQQAIVDAVNNAATDQSSSNDRAQRLAAALGHAFDPATIIDQQMSVLQTQIAGLQKASAAVGASNPALKKTIDDQIADLSVQLVEASASRFQAQVDAVNNTASTALARNDRAQRRAQIGRTDYAALGGALTDRETVLEGQRNQLQGLLYTAQQSGNTDQVDKLTDQLDDLDTTISENIQAIQDNTDAARDAAISKITSTSDFTGGALGSAISFFQALGSNTGTNQNSIIASLLQGQGQNLSTARTGLVGQLGSLLGYSSDETNNLQNLSGPDLVKYLTSIASGPAFDAIMARLDPTQQASFQTLISALLSNAAATQDNTQQIAVLTASNNQEFASSFWTHYRAAIFNGAGALMPQYASAVPTAAIGAKIVRSGMLVGHTGEVMQPAVVARQTDYSGNGAGEYHEHWHITTPKEVVDYQDLSRESSFKRRARQNGR